MTRLANESAGYVSAREQLRMAEIELTQQRERVAELRRELPLGATVDDYVFQEAAADLWADAPVRDVRLSELFTGPDRSLIVYHFMFGKAQTGACPMCTMWIDGYNPVAEHVERNADFVIVAAAELPELRAYARSRGWDRVRLLSASANTFKYDLASEDADGAQDSTVSVFTKDADGTVRHTYSGHPWLSPEIRERGIDALTPVWNLLDLTPQGRGSWYPSVTYETEAPCH